MSGLNRLKKHISGMLSMLLTLSLVLAGMPGTSAQTQVSRVRAADKSVKIQNLEDFLKFAQACKDVDYSVGMEVSLLSDIDLSEMPDDAEFQGITSFSGVFRGNFHTISGMSLSEEGEAIGLFCYVEQGARVQDLRVKGKIDCSDSKTAAGGIAGINAGTIQGCYFKGTVSSLGETGGIAGKNGRDGLISRCMNSGAVDGQHKVGGIVGENRGTIKDCNNSCTVNADTKWLDFEGDEELSLSASGVWNSFQEKIEEGTDFGGIAGWNNGSVIGCSNKAVIGYPHAGKNVGGIVGFQKGSVIRCENTGRVYGKQDVGGIVGQFEPGLRKEDVEELGQQVNVLHDCVEQMIADMGKMGNDLHKDFQEINQKARETGDTLDALLTEMRQVVEKNVDNINEIAARIDYCTAHFETATAHLDQGLTQGEKLISDLEKVQKELSNKAQANNPEKMWEDLTGKDEPFGGDDNPGGTNQQGEASKPVETDQQDGTSQQGGTNPAGEKKNPEEMLDDLKDGIGSDAGKPEPDNNDQESDQGTGDSETETEEVNELVEEVRDTVSKDAHAMSDSLQAAGKEFKTIAEYLNAQEKLRAVNLSADFDRNSEKLKTELDEMLDLLDRLDQHMYQHSEVLENDMRKVNDQTNHVLTILSDRLDNMQSMANGEDIIIDLSSLENASSDQAKVEQCTNEGVITGDRNVGGIAGTMGVEKTDTAKGTTLTVGNRYIAGAVMVNCTNQGFITVKTENAGGIVGNQEIGLVSGCLAQGRVQGAEANYLGGIAGRSEGRIVSSGSLAVLDGCNEIGGIAGQAKAVQDCYSMVTVLGAKEWVGAVVGRQEFDEDEDDVTILRKLAREKMTGNYYCSSYLYGINGTSTSGVAQAVTYQELLALDKVPEAFSELSVSFIDADQNLIQRVSLPYGYDLTKLEYPKVKTDNGEYMEWSGLQGEKLEGNLVLQAREMTLVTILSGEAQEKKRPIVLAEGTFTEKAKITVKEYAGSLPDNLPEGSVWHCYKVELENASLMPETVTRVRLLCEEEGDTFLYRLDGGKWVKLEIKKIGSYAETQMLGTEGVFCICTMEKSLSTVLLIGIVCAILLLLVLVVVITIGANRHKKNKRRKNLMENLE